MNVDRKVHAHCIVQIKQTAPVHKYRWEQIIDYPPVTLILDSLREAFPPVSIPHIGEYIVDSPGVVRYFHWCVASTTVAIDVVALSKLNREAWSMVSSDKSLVVTVVMVIAVDAKPSMSDL